MGTPCPDLSVHLDKTGVEVRMALTLSEQPGALLANPELNLISWLLSLITSLRNWARLGRKTRSKSQEPPVHIPDDLCLCLCPLEWAWHSHILIEVGTWTQQVWPGNTMVPRSYRLHWATLTEMQHLSPSLEGFLGLPTLFSALIKSTISQVSFLMVLDKLSEPA